MDPTTHGANLAGDLKRSLLELFCDVSLLPQDTDAAFQAKRMALASLVGLSEEIGLHLKDFRSGIEGKLKFMERAGARAPRYPSS